MSENKTITRGEAYLRRRRKVFQAFIRDGGLDYLKEHFQTDLPCFQGAAGTFDPLDAMRRDAERGVCLFIESDAAMLRDNNDNDNDDDD